MTLQATFSVTPRESYLYYYNILRSQLWAHLTIYGAVFPPKLYPAYEFAFDAQHWNNRLYFRDDHAADPTLNYASWANRRMAPRVELAYNLSSLGANKELALIFGFEVLSESRVLIFTSTGLLGDETLVSGDNQFLLEVESLDFLNLYFIHANRDGYSFGGDWFFKGITGYVI